MALQSLGSGQAGLFSVFSLVSSLEAVLLSICRHTVLTCVVPRDRPFGGLWEGQLLCTKGRDCHPTPCFCAVLPAAEARGPAWVSPVC